MPFQYKVLFSRADFYRFQINFKRILKETPDKNKIL